MKPWNESWITFCMIKYKDFTVIFCNFFFSYYYITVVKPCFTTFYTREDERRVYHNMISLNVNKLSVSAIINQRRNFLYMLSRWRGSLVALCKFQYETARGRTCYDFPMVKTNYMLLYYLSIYSFWPANVCKCEFCFFVRH